MQIINMVGGGPRRNHMLRLSTPDGTIMHVPPSGMQVRVQEHYADPIWNPELPVPYVPFPKQGRLAGMPAPQDGCIYIVSKVVLFHPDVAGRTDVFAPNSGVGAIRSDRTGYMHAATQLIQAPARALYL